jgi:hypothetical protein
MDEEPKSLGHRAAERPLPIDNLRHTNPTAPTLPREAQYTGHRARISDRVDAFLALPGHDGDP